MLFMYQSMVRTWLCGFRITIISKNGSLLSCSSSNVNWMLLLALLTVVNKFLLLPFVDFKIDERIWRLLCCARKICFAYFWFEFSPLFSSPFSWIFSSPLYILIWHLRLLHLLFIKYTPGWVHLKVEIWRCLQGKGSAFFARWFCFKFSHNSSFRAVHLTLFGSERHQQKNTQKLNPLQRASTRGFLHFFFVVFVFSFA